MTSAFRLKFSVMCTSSASLLKRVVVGLFLKSQIPYCCRDLGVLQIIENRFFLCLWFFVDFLTFPFPWFGGIVKQTCKWVSIKDFTHFGIINYFMSLEIPICTVFEQISIQIGFDPLRVVHISSTVQKRLWFRDNSLSITALKGNI